jgi:hypothetical protein
MVCPTPVCMKMREPMTRRATSRFSDETSSPETRSRSLPLPTIRPLMCFIHSSAARVRNGGGRSTTTRHSLGAAQPARSRIPLAQPMKRRPPASLGGGRPWRVICPARAAGSVRFQVIDYQPTVFAHIDDPWQGRPRCCLMVARRSAARRTAAFDEWQRFYLACGTVAERRLPGRTIGEAGVPPGIWPISITRHDKIRHSSVAGPQISPKVARLGARRSVPAGGQRLFRSPPCLRPE